MNDHKLASHLVAPENTEFLKLQKGKGKQWLFNAKGFRLLASSAKSNASMLIFT